MYSSLHWEVTKYGTLIECSDIENTNFGIVTTKIYKYENKFYLEVWQNGIRLTFKELIE